MPGLVRDTLGRPLASLRISLTDRCNLRCHYCMPEEHYRWLARDVLLSSDELVRLARVFVGLGVRKLRLTGGEPLLRGDAADVIRRLAQIAGLDEISLTTNGTRLAVQARALRDAGLHRLTVSVDTLRRERFNALTRSDELPSVLAGLSAATATGFVGTKINTVVIRGFNDDELCDLVSFAKEHEAEVRFIEYMDVGGATRWSKDAVVSRDEILARLAARFGAPRPLSVGGSAPAQRYALPDGTVFGVIASTTAPFCRACDRARLTADGTFFLCLYDAAGHDLRGLVRGRASDLELREAIAAAWTVRTSRGAEQRAALLERGPLATLDELTHDLRLEMHTRGG